MPKLQQEGFRAILSPIPLHAHESMKENVCVQDAQEAKLTHRQERRRESKT